VLGRRFSRSEFDLDKRVEVILEAQRFFMKEHGPQIGTITDTATALTGNGCTASTRTSAGGHISTWGVHEWLMPKS
jgi:hypothetical protein